MLNFTIEVMIKLFVKGVRACEAVLMTCCATARATIIENSSVTVQTK